MTEVPTLHTERLRLRAPRRDDFPAYEAFCASDRARLMGGPMTQQAAWAMFCRGAASWSLHGFGCWSIERREDDAYLGEVGLNGHPYFPETELGWIVIADAEGKGVAREAATEARRWAFEDLGLSTVVSYIHRDNARSIALAERLGASVDPNAPPCPYADHDVYRHPAPEAVA